MIERYFFPGAAFSWAPPQAITTQPKDGTVTVSPPTPSVMTFQDLDPHHFDTSTMNRFRSLGLTKNQAIPHDWLCYIHGRTAKISSANDVLTGFMSGCYIAVWTDNTGRQVGHIGTIESVGKNQPPNSTVKQTFSAMMPNNVKAYNPAEAWNFNEIMALTRKYPHYDGWWNVLSLVTSDSRFYSILLLKHRRNDPLITCAGIKSCAGIGVNMMRQLLA